MSRIALVLAMADNGVIGRGGQLPWRIPEDMRRFKELTLGKPCIMGRRTWQSLPKKPLPGRSNIIVTRDKTFPAREAMVAHSLAQALEVARRDNPPEIMIIGGAEIYREALPLADAIHLTEVHKAFDGDTRLTAFSPGEWREMERENHVSESGLAFSFVRLERRKPN